MDINEKITAESNRSKVAMDAERCSLALDNTGLGLRAFALHSGLSTTAVSRCKAGDSVTGETACLYSFGVGQPLTTLVRSEFREIAEYLQPRIDAGDLALKKYHQAGGKHFPPEDTVTFAPRLTDDSLYDLGKSASYRHVLEHPSPKWAEKDEDQPPIVWRSSDAGPADENDDGRDQLDAGSGTANHDEHEYICRYLEQQPQISLSMTPLWLDHDQSKKSSGTAELLTQINKAITSLAGKNDSVKPDGSLESILARTESAPTEFNMVERLRRPNGVYLYGCLLETCARREIPHTVKPLRPFAERETISYWCILKVPLLIISSEQVPPILVSYRRQPPQNIALRGDGLW